VNTGRLAGVFYLGTFVSGMIAFAAGTGMMVANAIATVCYVGVTVLFYVLFKRVSARLSLIAAIVSFCGCAISVLAVFGLNPVQLNPLPFFGCYCILIGYLLAVSSFAPRALGAALAIGGISWLTFASPALARALAPYNYAPGILAEGALTVWLLARGAPA
jgi:uncharacterized protein DUF4386